MNKAYTTIVPTDAGWAIKITTNWTTDIGRTYSTLSQASKVRNEMIRRSGGTLA